MRVYADGDLEIKNRVLDQVDRSIELDVYAVKNALGRHDRPWLATGAAA